jgi:hypothetical protein
MKGYAKPARKGIIMTDPNTITAKSNNERHLSEVLHTLRKVTSATTDDDKARIVLYLDSIAVEIEQINATRTPLLGLEACKKCRLLGHLCPACTAGSGPVLELGECPTCSGRTVDLPGGATCHYCRTVVPHPADDWS